jgi:Na+/alanine symporter
MANTIEWGGMSAFAALDLSAVELAGVEVGQSKNHKGLTFLQIESAGHMGKEIIRCALIVTHLIFFFAFTLLLCSSYRSARNIIYCYQHGIVYPREWTQAMNAVRVSPYLCHIF